MGLLTVSDQIAMAATGQQAKELPNLRTVPYGYYLKRAGEIGRLHADHSFIPHYIAKGHEFLGYETDITLSDAEACVYLRLVGEVTDPKPKRAKKKKRKTKKGGKV